MKTTHGLMVWLLGISPLAGEVPNRAGGLDGLRHAAAAPDAGAADWVRLGDALMQRSRETQDHDFGAAREAYEEALAHDDGNLDGLVGMAWVGNSEHDFAAGAKWAKRALEADPRCLRAHALLGDGAMELGEYDLAHDHLQQALDIRTDLSTLSRAAHLLWLTGDPNRAKVLMARAIRAGGVEPEHSAWCRAELAGMHFKTGAMLPAEREAELALELAPENPRVLVVLARIRAAQDREAEAVELLERSLAVSTTHEALEALVRLHLAAGNEAAAESRSEELLSFHGHHSHGHGHAHGHGHSHGDGNAQLAEFMADRGIDPADALHLAEHDYETYPNIQVADAVAWCAYQAGDLAKARRMIRRALRWRTAEPEFHYHAGVILEASGDRSAAIRHWNQALSLNPRFDPLMADRARGEIKRLRALAGASPDGR